MTLSDRVVIPAHVMARQVGEETVILDLASGTYFGLDTVGARIWQLMGEGRMLAEVCAAMLAEYEVSADDIEPVPGPVSPKPASASPLVSRGSQVLRCSGVPNR